MTLPAGINKEVYSGDGLATEFDYDWKITDSDQLSVYLVNSSGVSTLLTSGYTVTRVGRSGGGQVVMDVAPATGESLVILSNFATQQQTDLRNRGRFFPETIEDALDYVVNLVKQSDERFGRSLMKQPGESEFDAAGARVKNVGEPVNPGDAASKNYIDTKAQATLADATEQANRAEEEADRAEQAAGSAADEAVSRAEEQLQYYTDKATDSASDAALSASSAASSASLAVDAKIGAQVARGQAVSSAISAEQSAQEAEDSANTIQSYETQYFNNLVVLPIDLGSVADPIIQQSYDLGEL